MTYTMTTMTVIEARECVELINKHMGNLRALLLDLHNRKGWQVLGYSSWRECVNQEFAYEETYLYRLLKAAQIETDLGLPMGEMPERQLRELAPLSIEDQRAVIKVVDLVANEAGVQRSASLFKSVAEVITTGVLTETLDGKVTLNEAAKNTFVEHLFERKERQKQHIADNAQNTAYKARCAFVTVNAVGEITIAPESGDLSVLTELLNKKLFVIIREAKDQ